MPKIPKAEAYSTTAPKYMNHIKCILIITFKIKAFMYLCSKVLSNKAR